MASLRDIRRRITSVKNTRQITRAMKLVAGAKLRRATSNATAARPYQRTLRRVLDRVVRAAGEVEHPLLVVPDNHVDVVVVLLTSDRGLCGSFNSSVCRATQEKIDELLDGGKKVRIVAYGKKGRGFFARRGYDVVEEHIDLDPAEYFEMAQSLADRLAVQMGGDEFEMVMLAFNEFRSVMTQSPSFDQLLPMKVEPVDGEEPEDEAGLTEYIFEPSAGELLGGLLPTALRTQIFQAFLETQAGEQAARMTAMDNATRNASELIDALTLEYNRARQASITKELIEIVSGAEAQ